ncbi:DUF2460 domain-containing protein [Roseobacter sp. HKCCA0434]|uniref:DUF2460 domain-containing protein n=1 Tax=Roseobacter sp. HKCCA0434 TaxID=3079297 RepID=UPI00290588AD|nr:DUF2460 domain-containing protein [Roseobacter sp. HKCCA0434]
MSFHEVRFPLSIGFGSTGGPERRTEIVTLASGHEERNTPWAHSRRRYDAGLGMRSRDDLEEVIAFFEARAGQLHGFRWRDWSDWRTAPSSREIEAFDTEIGVGDGVMTAFQLSKTYRSGPATYVRPIVKPVAGTLRLAVGGVQIYSGFALDHVTGIVSFDVAPQDGAVIEAGFEFDVPVRFDTDRIETSLGAFEAGEIPSIPVVEVRV